MTTTKSSLPTIALVWSQLGPYHVDRCEAVGRGLAGKAEVLAVEVATSSETYAWEASGEIPGVRKVTLYPGRTRDSLSVWEKLRAQVRVLRRCHTVFIGVPYSRVDVILLTIVLRLLRIRVVVMNDSKFDDLPRSAFFELFKSLVLSVYAGAIVAGGRQIEYMRFLGFKKRPVLPGYDVVGVERVRSQVRQPLAPQGLPFEERPFIFVGRFVPKKNLATLLRAYAIYRSQTASSPRALVLAGAGPDEAALRAEAERLGVAAHVQFTGFLTAAQVADRLAGSLALLLVSVEEQWGLVVNEALAVGLPVIVSQQVGARDALVRNLVNGFVVEQHSMASIVCAMLAMTADKGDWERMVRASQERAWLGDCQRLADSIELLMDPTAQAARERAERLLAELGVP